MTQAQLQSLIGERVQLWFNDYNVIGTLGAAYSDYRVDTLWNKDVCVLFPLASVASIQISPCDIAHIIINQKGV